MHLAPGTGTRSSIGHHFNLRVMEMRSDMGQLALALDPHHRGMVMGDPETQNKIVLTMMLYWQRLGFSQEETIALVRVCSSLFESPYNQELGAPGFEGCMSYWKALSAPSPQLSTLGLMTFSMCPQASPTERTFSFFSRQQTKGRSGLKVTSLQKLSTIHEHERTQAAASSSAPARKSLAMEGARTARTASPPAAVTQHAAAQPQAEAAAQPPPEGDEVDDDEGDLGTDRGAKEAVDAMVELLVDAEKAHPPEDILMASSLKDREDTFVLPPAATFPCVTSGPGCKPLAVSMAHPVVIQRGLVCRCRTTSTLWLLRACPGRRSHRRTGSRQLALLLTAEACALVWWMQRCRWLTSQRCSQRWHRYRHRPLQGRQRRCARYLPN
jgi:hypothetical protein